MVSGTTLSSDLGWDRYLSAVSGRKTFSGKPCHTDAVSESAVFVPRHDTPYNHPAPWAAPHNATSRHLLQKAPLHPPRDPPCTRPPPHRRERNLHVMKQATTICKKGKGTRLQSSSKPSQGSLLTPSTRAAVTLPCSSSRPLARPKPDPSLLIPSAGHPGVRTSRGRCRRPGDPGALSGRHTTRPSSLFFQVVWEPVKLLEAPGNCVFLPRLRTRRWGRGSWPSPEHPLLSSALFCSQPGVSFWH